MAYNENIPQPTDRLKDSQPELLGNFQAIDTVVSVNHVTFDDPSGFQGKHKWVTFPQQAIDPVDSNPAATDMFLFNKKDGSNVNQIFLKKSTGGAPLPITSSGGPSGPGVSGWSYLPSGKIIKWSFGTTVGNTVVVDANSGIYPVGAPVLTAIQTIQLTAKQNAVFWINGFASATTFNVNSSVANANFAYMVIGSN